MGRYEVILERTSEILQTSCSRHGNGRNLYVILSSLGRVSVP